MGGQEEGREIVEDLQVLKELPDHGCYRLRL